MAKENVIPKKGRLKSRSNSADTRGKRVASTDARMFQRLYRMSCLEQRKTEDRLTEKNWIEMASLGMQVSDRV